MLWHDLSRSRLFDNFKEIERFQSRLNRLFYGDTSFARATSYPPINVYASEDSVVVTAELPGIEGKDLNLAIINDTLTIEGVRDQEEGLTGQTLRNKERVCGQFARSIQLPFRVDSDNVIANFRKGILHLTLPRMAQDKPRKISVSCESLN